MPQLETFVKQELTEPVKVHYLDGIVFSEDNHGNIVGVEVFNHGTPFSLAGCSCTAYCVLATGASIPVAGTVSGNKAYISMPDSAYTTPGTINIIIKLIDGATITTLAAIVSTVYGIGSPVANPSTATIAEWTAQINATITALQNGAVRYDTSQSLTNAQKTQAQNNIGAKTSVTQLHEDDYRIVIP